MKTPISCYGGQQRSLKHILPLIPEHELYNEPFAGGAALLFAKEPAKINVINDLNGELMNFYRTVVTDFIPLNIEIMKTLHSRDQHRLAQFIYHNPSQFDNVKRAWAVWVLSKMGFACQLNGSYVADRSPPKVPSRVLKRRTTCRLSSDIGALSPSADA